MSPKDSIKQRRQQKIKRLLERDLGAGQEERTVAPPVDYEAKSNARLEKNRTAFSKNKEELDPELAWKKNPNPWVSWQDGTGNSSTRSFVNRPAQSNKRTVNSNRTWPTFWKELRWKLVIAALLFVGVWSIFHYNNEWTLRGQAYIKQAMTDEIDFAAAAAWYNQTFAGAPSFIPIFKDQSGKAIGVDGKVKFPTVSPLSEASLVRTFAELLNGIELAGPSAGQVVAAETGRVILVTDEHISIIIQHANKRVTVYGGLGEADVKVNDWVEAGDPIGRLPEADDGAQSLLYFAIKDNDHYVDPLDVISID